MPQPETDDDTDFIPLKKWKKGEAIQPTPQPKAVATPEPEPEPASKSRFPARMIREAEAFGFTPEDLEECATVADLGTLLKYEREKQSDLRAAKLGRAGTGREGTPAVEVPTSPAPAKQEVTPPPEDVWNFEEDMSEYDENLRKELARIGRFAQKTSKGVATKEELTALQKKLDDAHTVISALQAANNPVIKRANAVVLKYPSLFGSVLDEYGRPPDGTDEADRFDSLLAKHNRMVTAGKVTGIPEKDIPAAIAALWPGVKAGDTAAEPELPVTPPSKQIVKKVVQPPEKTEKPTNGTNRIAEWNDGAQAAPTGRNGADRTGIASDSDAKKKIGQHLKKMGVPTEGDTEEDDLEDF